MNELTDILEKNKLYSFEILESALQKNDIKFTVQELTEKGKIKEQTKGFYCLPYRNKRRPKRKKPFAYGFTGITGQFYALNEFANQDKYRFAVYENLHAFENYEKSICYIDSKTALQDTDIDDYYLFEISHQKGKEYKFSTIDGELIFPLKCGQTELKSYLEKLKKQFPKLEYTFTKIKNHVSKLD